MRSVCGATKIFPALVLTAVMWIAAEGHALEKTFPLKAYSEAELATVRSWEQQWVGQKITSANLSQVAEYLPECLQFVYNNPRKCGAPADTGLYFTIVPYAPIVETKGMIEATRAYAPQVRVDDQGIIENYKDIAGMPFPDPQTGQEIAWNYDMNTRGDSSHYRRYTPNVDLNHFEERIQDADCWELYFAHRVDAEPKPRLPKNKKQIHWAGFYHMYKPNEFLNTRRFNIRFLDFNKEDDNYMYNAQTRRLTRLSGSHRTDSVDGSIVIYDDEFCWNGQITRNIYNYLGRKEYLGARHIDLDTLERQQGQLIYNNLTRERVNTFAVEVVSKDPDYIYSKRIWYVDPETYHILCTQIYDKNGQFWKFIEQFTQNLKTATGEDKSFLVGCHVIDYQRKYAACTRQTVKGIGIELRPSMFTLGNLQRAAY